MSLNYKPLYVDTDGAYNMNDAIATKQMLNSLYGIKGAKRMNREYISIIDVNDNPVVIFKRNIISVTKDDKYTDILCTDNHNFFTIESYASVVKKIIG